MARVRIEIWDNGDNIQQAEAEHIDPREAFERAVRMARAAIPEEKKGPLLDAGSYTFEMKNAQLTDVTRQMLFLDAEGRKQAGFDVKIVSDAPPRKPCGQRCQDDDGPCTDTCARPAGHDDWHVTSDGACTWGPEEGEGDAERCLNEIGAPSKTRNCQQPLNHDGLCDGEQEEGDCVAGMRD